MTSQKRAECDAAILAAATFQEKIQAGVYDNRLLFVSHKCNRAIWEAFQKEEAEKYSLFMTDLKAEALALGVPEIYADKVCTKAWEDDHSFGYSEVYNCLVGLSEIFFLTF